MRSLVTLLPLLAFMTFVPACGNEEISGLFSKAEAEKVARQVIKSWGEGRSAEVKKLCAVPFHFGTRTWVTADSLRQNLEYQVGRLRTDAARFTEFEIFSRLDLEQGRWPRGRKIPKGKRQDEIHRVGVSSDGFLVRVSREKAAGWQLVLNPEGAENLVLQAVYP